ncbi:hypothetical protein TUM18999_22770 [Pseudomonas tohonis]|uniref:Uncharacterized protein n=1 Tax=Pseudomonas tohonis TaxID=2725477 RepID=A0A6J4E495_9PSED|nr:isoprenylcysteine carboxylmethyltransferase family protein [Pseudomonas tohonis]BCG24086.1 hypothetical protein TUM18999_22770 [Pseudomonas tohonis]GJN55621.1 hypothetical protein TUM20286_53730 [Pseudomonas tohonis]
MNSTLGRTASFTFGVISYLVFLAAFILSIAFVANLPWAPARLDGEPLLPLGWALAIDAALLVAASLVYRVSRGAAQSARVLLGSLATLALLALWQPLGGELWRVEGPALRQVLAAAFGLGGALLLYAVLLGDQLAAGGLHAAARRLFGLAEEGREEAGEEWRRQRRDASSLGVLLLAWATPEPSAVHLALALLASLAVYLAWRRPLAGLPVEGRIEPQAVRSQRLLLVASRKAGTPVDPVRAA